jgi:hypothetical protein
MISSVFGSRMIDTDGASSVAWAPVGTHLIGITQRLETTLDIEADPGSAPPCLVVPGLGGIGKVPFAVSNILLDGKTWEMDLTFSGSGVTFNINETLTLGNSITSTASGVQTTWSGSYSIASIRERYAKKSHEFPSGSPMRGGDITIRPWRTGYQDAYTDTEAAAGAQLNCDFWTEWPEVHRVSGIQYYPALDTWTILPGVFHIFADGGEDPAPLAGVNNGGGSSWTGTIKVASNLFYGADYHYYSRSDATLSGTVTPSTFLPVY